MKRFFINNNKSAISIIFSIVVILTFANTASAFDEINTSLFGVAIKGYDTVAYHTEGRALKGSSKFTHKWNDAKWYFISEANRDLFIKEPERFAPQYGGYWARNIATAGKVAGVNPEAFKIIEGRLYLNYSAESADKFAADAKENIEKADKNWKNLKTGNWEKVLSYRFLIPDQLFSGHRQ